jgi:hypothetical protein
MAKAMNLEIWSGGWGLPSVDQRCLEIMVNLLPYFVGDNARFKRAVVKSVASFCAGVCQVLGRPVEAETIG